tara:strand:- start:132 stop:299 length:168 start_codon:yes stop_codon:yes gene_type:complete
MRAEIVILGQLSLLIAGIVLSSCRLRAGSLGWSWLTAVSCFDHPHVIALILMMIR